MKKVLIGAGGHAREIIAQMGVTLDMYVDDDYVTSETKSLSSLNFNDCLLMVAIGDSHKREQIVKRLPKNANYFSFIHPTALILNKNIDIGEGSFIGAYSVLTTDIKIGKHSLLNRFNQIGHDCEIGDFLSMMPGSIISGNCKIGKCFYIGNNSSIREKIEIKDYITIGLNSGVVNNLTESGIYVGSPSRIIKKSL